MPPNLPAISMTSPSLMLRSCIAVRLSRAVMFAGLCTNLPWLMLPWYALTTAAGAMIVEGPVMVDVRPALARLFELPLTGPAFWTQALDILATGGQARTVTAHVLLRFDTTGSKTGTTTVRGRLFLTRKRGAWRIFGYDIAKGERTNFYPSTMRSPSAGETILSVGGVASSTSG